MTNKQRLLAICGALALFPVYHVANIYLDQRAAKKAEIEEFWRREHMAPEQRIAESKAKEETARRAKADADEAARVADVAAQFSAARERADADKAEKAKFEAQGRSACLAWWRQTLNDPDSAKLTNADWVFNDGAYHGWINGRAKNSFGAYIMATWDCQLRISNETVLPISFTQRRAH